MEGNGVKGILARRNSMYKMLALGEARLPRELEEAQKAGRVREQRRRKAESRCGGL